MGTLYILCGLPFSGKTTLQQALTKRLGFSVVSVDQIMDEREMWREGHPTQADWDEAYSDAYQRMETLLREGKTLVFDCANLSFRERESSRKLAASLGAEHRLIYVKTLQEEIARRRHLNEYTHERGQIDQTMMDYAVSIFDEPTESEQPIVYTPQTDLDLWITRHFRERDFPGSSHPA